VGTTGNGKTPAEAAARPSPKTSGKTAHLLMRQTVTTAGLRASLFALLLSDFHCLTADDADYADTSNQETKQRGIDFSFQHFSFQLFPSTFSLLPLAFGLTLPDSRHTLAAMAARKKLSREESTPCAQPQAQAR
jgi:hypothetical protein